MKLGRLVGLAAIVASTGLLLGCANQDEGCEGKCAARGTNAAKAPDQRVSLAADTSGASGKAGKSCCSSSHPGSPAAGQASCAGNDPAKCTRSCGSARLAADTTGSSGCASKGAMTAKAGCHSKGAATASKGCGGMDKPASGCSKKGKAAAVQADASTE